MAKKRKSDAELEAAWLSRRAKVEGILARLEERSQHDHVRHDAVLACAS